MKRILVLLLVVLIVTAQIDDDVLKHKIEQAKQSMKDTARIIDEVEDVSAKTEAKMGSVDLVLIKTMSDSYQEMVKQRDSLRITIQQYHITAKQSAIVTKMIETLQHMKSRDKVGDLTIELKSQLRHDSTLIKKSINRLSDSLRSTLKVYETSLDRYFKEKRSSMQLSADDEKNMRSEVVDTRTILDSADQIIAK